jgi:hypothetical protein
MLIFALDKIYNAQEKRDNSVEMYVHLLFCQSAHTLNTLEPVFLGNDDRPQQTDEYCFLERAPYNIWPHIKQLLTKVLIFKRIHMLSILQPRPKGGCLKHCMAMSVMFGNSGS